MNILAAEAAVESWPLWASILIISVALIFLILVGVLSYFLLVIVPKARVRRAAELDLLQQKVRQEQIDAVVEQLSQQDSGCGCGSESSGGCCGGGETADQASVGQPISEILEQEAAEAPAAQSGGGCGAGCGCGSSPAAEAEPVAARTNNAVAE